MKQVMRVVALGAINLVLMNSIVAANAFATDNSAVLLKDIKSLQASIDSGKVAETAAIDQFAQAISEQNISVQDVNAFVKTQMTASQAEAFQTKMNSALRGVNPETLTPEETGEIVGQALAGVHTEGLYWDSCATMWTGAALIVAAIYVGTIAIAKSKSIASIQKDYTNRINDLHATTATEVQEAQNWQTAYPQEISYARSRISSDSSDIDYQESRLRSLDNSTSSQAERDSIIASINYDNDDIETQLNRIDFYNQKIIEYTQNPSQVQVDIASYQAYDASETIVLQNKEADAVAKAPANQALGKKLGIGAGIGAAVGVGLGIYGLNQGCQVW